MKSLAKLPLNFYVKTDETVAKSDDAGSRRMRRLIARRTGKPYESRDLAAHEKNREKAPEHTAKADIATIAVMDGTKLLLGKRRDNERWTNPGGHMDEGENPVDGAARELKEEAGLVVDPAKLTSLGKKKITTFTGKKNTIHVFKYEVEGKVRPSSKNDPDQEVEKWEWVETKDGLPGEVSNNLHSPKNVLLQKLGLQKAEELYILDIIKGMNGHKYIRRYQRGGKWQYVYHEGQGRPRAISEEAVGHIKKLAELGDEHAKKLHAGIEDHNEEKLKLLRELADHGDEGAKKHLHSLGIDREKEKLEDALVPPPRDASETDLEGPRHTQAVQAIKQAVDNAVFTYLRSHAASPYAQKLTKNGINLESIMDKVKEKTTPKAMLDELHEQMKRIDAAHAGLPATQNSNASQAGGYGSLAYNRAVEELQRGPNPIVPEGYHELHRRQGAESRPAVTPFAQIEETRRKQREEREASERRALGEVAGSMAHGLNQFMRTPLPAREILKIHETFKKMFGKNMRAEDWPYDFSGSGLKVTINRVSCEGNRVSFEFNVKDRNGQTVTDSWSRTWSADRDGHPKIYNAYLSVNSSARGSDQPLGMLINKSQAKLMKEHAPETGVIAVHAALDVGGYNWANQGFEYESDHEARQARDRFESFAASHGVNLTREELAHFKQPCHFAAFHNGKLYETSLSTPIKITSKQREKGEIAPGVPLKQDEISSGKTSRMYVHLGKKFLLGSHFHGVLRAKNMNDGNEAYRYMQNYDTLKLKSWTTLNAGYKAAVKRTGGGAETPTIVAQRDQGYSRTSSAPPMRGTAARRRTVRRPASFARATPESQQRWLDANRANMSSAQIRSARALMNRGR